MVDELVEVYVGHKSGYQIFDKYLSIFQDTKITYVDKFVEVFVGLTALVSATR